MKAVIQRVSHAKVVVEGSVTGSIEAGFLVLVGVTHDDDISTAVKLARKVARLRIFSDQEGKTNLSLLDTKGSALVVSQFTLYANTSKGNRPSFGQAAVSDKAKGLIGAFVEKLREEGVQHIGQGVFGANMQVTLCNDGPFTVILES
ncbi:MAG: D-tyrosyl-tRNA(Tyr) deacylase [Acidobacteria bacterium]|nr:MAG: D-tyrosyl-tRNA(Tyr) deacylase [Acidobacteriota bacterium]